MSRLFQVGKQKFLHGEKLQNVCISEDRWAVPTDPPIFRPSGKTAPEKHTVPEVGPDMEAEYGEGILGAGYCVHHPPLTRAAPVHGTSIPSGNLKKPLIKTLKSLYLVNTRDPEWENNPDPGFGMNIPDHFSESLETVLWVKIT